MAGRARRARGEQRVRDPKSKSRIVKVLTHFTLPRRKLGRERKGEVR